MIIFMSWLLGLSVHESLSVTPGASEDLSGVSSGLINNAVLMGLNSVCDCEPGQMVTATGQL